MGGKLSALCLLLCCCVRYAVVPTPLSRLVFWRLVMDEAQLTGGTTKAAEMAQHIRAQHRWAITGAAPCMGLRGTHAVVSTGCAHVAWTLLNCAVQMGHFTVVTIQAIAWIRTLVSAAADTIFYGCLVWNMRLQSL